MILKDGSQGHAVIEWQTFLASEDVFQGAFDGIFGRKTTTATKIFQNLMGLKADGIAGPKTFSIAMSTGWNGFHHEKEQEAVKKALKLNVIPGFMDPAWPPILDENNDGRSDIVYRGGEWREEAFGHIEYRLNPQENNREAIKITNDFAKKIIKVIVPQLIGVPYAPKSGGIYFHEKCTDQLLSMFNEWQKAGLMRYVKSWAGSFVPRMIRGSTKTLSNHAYGSAFDINAPWNGLGRTPALVGQEGTVRPLVTIAEQHGFYWGGRYTGRKDGMHFEVVKIL